MLSVLILTFGNIRIWQLELATSYTNEIGMECRPRKVNILHIRRDTSSELHRGL